jgi:predicted ABC-type ATPase
MANLAAALRTVQSVFVYDNSDLTAPYQHVAIFQNGSLIWRRAKPPKWFAPLLRTKPTSLPL